MLQVENIASLEPLKPCFGASRRMASASEISRLPSVTDPEMTLMILGSLYIIVASALFSVITVGSWDRLASLIWVKASVSFGLFSNCSNSNLSWLNSLLIWEEAPSESLV
jgi:uncharacterized membrane protein